MSSTTEPSTKQQLAQPRRFARLVSFRDNVSLHNSWDAPSTYHHLEVFVVRNARTGLLELPGRAMRSNRPQLERIAREVSRGATIEQVKPYPRQVAVLYDEDRESAEGFAVHAIYAVKFTTEPGRGEWVGLQALPEDIDPRHRPMIEAALRVYTHQSRRIIALAFWGVATEEDARNWETGIGYDFDYGDAWRDPVYMAEIAARDEYYHSHRFWQEAIRELVKLWEAQFALD